MSNVSLFPHIKQATNPHNAPLRTVLANIKTGKWRKHTDSYRTMVKIHGKRSVNAKEAKKSIPYFTTSGVFEKRSEAGLIEHSGFVAVDIDDLKDDEMPRVKGRLASSKYAYSVFESVGGAGLCLIMRIKPEEHAEVFEEIRDYLARFYGVEIDFLADISRARFVSFDPDLRLDENAQTFVLGCEAAPDKSDQAQVQEFWTDEEQLDFAANWVRQNKGLDFVEGQRHQFIFAVATFCNKLGVGQSAVEAWAQQYAHWQRQPSNAIAYPYARYQPDHGKLKKPKLTSTAQNGKRLDTHDTRLDKADVNPAETPKSQEITFSFKPVETFPVLLVNDVRACSMGNFMTIVAYPGYGKSQTCEAIAAAWINPECDALGFAVDLPDEKTLLYIDGERTHEDAKKGFMRISRRVDVANHPELIEGDRMQRFRYESFIGIADVAERKAELQRLIEAHNPGLIIIDDVTTLIEGVNDDKEAKGMRQWLVAEANTKGFGVVVTIHPNPGDTANYKPRGHIGSEMLRVSESVYALLRAEEDREIRRFTTDFHLSKTRSDVDVNETNYKWDQDAAMFMTCDYAGAKKHVNAVPNHIYLRMYDTFKALDNGGGEMTPFRARSKEFASKYAELYNVSERTAHRHAIEAVRQGVLGKDSPNKSETYYVIIFPQNQEVPF